MGIVEAVLWITPLLSIHYFTVVSESNSREKYLGRTVDRGSFLQIKRKSLEINGISNRGLSWLIPPTRYATKRGHKKSYQLKVKLRQGWWYEWPG